MNADRLVEQIAEAIKDAVWADNEAIREAMLVDDSLRRVAEAVLRFIGDAVRDGYSDGVVDERARLRGLVEPERMLMLCRIEPENWNSWWSPSAVGGLGQEGDAT